MLREAQVGAGALCFGYVYAAGAPHFCGVGEVEVEGLGAAEGAEGLHVSLGERSWVIEA
ncbi:MAG TPA: hypothetical protein VFQ47_01515 [Nitrososphaera sp.]|jgi:hypothetical protein|nr:hypothetical protein [Nitrososphaera sp.]